MKSPTLLGRDGTLLFVTRYLRLFAFGLISITLPLYLSALGFDGTRIGTMLTLTLVGDTIVTLFITTNADRIGRRRMLAVGGFLMVLAGILFVLTENFVLLLFAAIIGIISPSGNEVGPFLSIEQSSLSQIVPDRSRTRVFAWYNLAGSFATALGALCGGWGVQLLQHNGFSAVASYKVVIGGYAVVGVVLTVLFWRVSGAVETSPAPRPVSAGAGRLSELGARFGLHRSAGVVLRLSTLFSLDAFAGGFIVQSMLAYWFHARYGIDPGLLGSIIFGANLLAGGSSLVAARIAKRFGLINTMVFTHIPSNILLMVVPLMPSLALAVGVLFLRFSISQMDVPTRQSYVMSVVSPEERSAAAGVTGIARTVGASVSPVLAGVLVTSSVLLSVPFFLAGGLKIIYDVLLYRSFRSRQAGPK